MLVSKQDLERRGVVAQLAQFSPSHRISRNVRIEHLYALWTPFYPLSYVNEIEFAFPTRPSFGWSELTVEITLGRIQHPARRSSLSRLRGKFGF